MNRRNFLVSASIALGAFVFNGCSTSLNGMQVSDIEKKSEDVIVAIDRAMLIYRDGVADVENSGLILSDSMENVKSFPWYIGPNIALTRKDYEVTKYAGFPLLFPGFGLSGRLKSYIGGDAKTEDEIKEWLDKLKYKTPRQLYLDIRLFCKNNGNEEAYRSITIDNVEDAACRIVEWEYKRYIEYELGDKSSQGRLSKEQLDKLMENWVFYTGSGDEITLSVEDYYPYALVMLIMAARGKNEP